MTSRLLPLTLLLATLPALAQSTQSDPLDSATTADPKSGISLRLPKNWIPKTGIDDTAYQAPAKDRNDSGGLAPNVVLSKENKPGVKPDELNKAVEQKRKQYPKIFDSYEETEFSSTTLGNKPAKIIAFTALIQKKLKVHFRQVWVLETDTVYTITFTSLDSTWTQNAPIFDAVIRSAKVP